MNKHTGNGNHADAAYTFYKILDGYASKLGPCDLAEIRSAVGDCNADDWIGCLELVKMKRAGRTPVLAARMLTIYHELTGMMLKHDERFASAYAYSAYDLAFAKMVEVSCCAHEKTAEALEVLMDLWERNQDRASFLNVLRGFRMTSICHSMKPEQKYKFCPEDERRLIEFIDSAPEAFRAEPEAIHARETALQNLESCESSQK